MPADVAAGPRAALLVLAIIEPHEQRMDVDHGDRQHLLGRDDLQGHAAERSEPALGPEKRPVEVSAPASNFGSGAVLVQRDVNLTKLLRRRQSG
jgi:hypothetical protein